MYDDFAVIDARIVFDESATEKEVSNITDSIKENLDKLERDLANTKIRDPKILDGITNVKREIRESVNGIAEMASKASRLRGNYTSLQSQVGNMSKILKGTVRDSGKFGEVTEESLSKVKSDAKEAKLQYRGFNEELRKSANDVLPKTIQEMNLLLKSVRDVEKAEGRKQAGLQRASAALGTGSFGMSNDDIELLKKYGYEFDKNKMRARDLIRILNECKKKEEELVLEEEKREAALKQAIDATKIQISRLQQEKRQIRETTAQYYYKLRALKMLLFAITSLEDATDKFLKKTTSGIGKLAKLYLKLSTGFLGLGKILKNAGDSMSKFSKGTKSATKSHDGFVASLNFGFKTILKYVFGIRSFYFLINKLRRAMAEGIESLATQFPEVALQMDSIVSSLERMKNAIAAMVQPLLNILAPALEKISALFADLAYNIGSFFAALTGQDFTYYAKKIRKSYLDDEKAKKKDKKATEDLNDETDRQLSNLDKLNVLTTPKNKNKNDDEDDTSPVKDMFDIRPITSKAKDWIEKLKRFLKPILDAWKKEAEFVKDSWKYALKEIFDLWKSIARDFWRVWEEPETQRIFENLFHILGDIGLIIGNLARNFREAWDEGENGYKILKSIRDIILIITEGLRDAADYTVEWSDSLNFKPLLTAIADVLEKQIVPATQKVVDLFVQLYKDVLLEMIRFLIEDLSPIIIKIFGNLVESVGYLAENFLKAWNEADRGKKIISSIEDIIMMVANIILDASEYTKEWAKEIDFSKALDSVLAILKDLKKPIKFIAETVAKFWTNVLLPMWKNFIEQALPKLKDAVHRMVERIDWDRLGGIINKIFGVVEKFLEAYGDIMIGLLENIIDFMDDLIDSGALDSIVDFLDDIATFMQNNPKSISNLLTNLIKGLIFIKALLIPIKGMLKLAVGYFTVMNAFNQFSAAKALRGINSELSELTSKLLDMKSTGKIAADAVAESTSEVASATTSAVNGAEGAAATAGASLGATIVAGILAAIGGMEIGKALGENISRWLGNEADAELYESYSGIIGSLRMLKDFAISIFDWIGMGLEKLKKSIDNFSTSNGKLSEFNSGLDIMNNKLKDLGHISDDQFNKLNLAIEAWKEEGKSAEEITNLLSDRLKTMGVTSDDVAGALTQLYSESKITDSSYQNLRGVVNAMTESYKDNEASIYSINNSYEKQKEELGTVSAKIGENEIELLNLSSAMDDANTKTDNLGSSFEVLPNKMSMAVENMDIEALKVSEIPANMEEGFSNGMNESFGPNGEVISKKSEGIFSGLWNSIKEFFGISSPSKKFMELGQFMMAGLVQGLTQFASLPIQAIRTISTKIINTAKTLMGTNSLVNVGRNLITGLANGLLQSLNRALSAIRSVANQIVSAARRAFQVHSPSKIFEDIGKMITMGLAVGVEEESYNMETTFEDMIPKMDFIDSFYEKFVSMLSMIHEATISEFERIFTDIESLASKFDTMAMVEDIVNKASTMSIKVPDIAVGKSMPSNEKFIKQDDHNYGIDMSRLPQMLKNAFVEALSETGTLQGAGGDITITIDGREVFNAVAEQNDQYMKQHGGNSRFIR